MTSKEFVKQTVEFRGSEKCPITYVNRNRALSDAVFVHHNPPAGFQPSRKGESEWGFVWETLDGTMGQPKFPPLKDGYDFSLLPNLDPYDPTRYAITAQEIAEFQGKYLIGDIGISGFNLLTFIRGFEESLEDLYIEPENLMALMEKVIDFEMGVAESFCRMPEIDCVSFFDDWGTQNALMIDPKLFRTYFKPLYKKQFDLIHSYGKHVLFHTCGQVTDILDDLVEIGVDILNLNQPDIFPMERLAQYKGRVCFNCPVDHQTVAIHGTVDEIHDYAVRLRTAVSTDKGGFISNVEEYRSVGMNEDQYLALCDAFEAMRR